MSIEYWTRDSVVADELQEPRHTELQGWTAHVGIHTQNRDQWECEIYRGYRRSLKGCLVAVQSDKQGSYRTGLGM